MVMGPVEYVVLGFPGNQFTGELAPALKDLIDKKLIRVLDLVFIAKDGAGDVVAFEFDQLDELAEFEPSCGESRGVLTPDDIAHAAETLAPDSSAALLIWEDLWAADFAQALRGCNGIVLEGGRVPAELIETALAELAEAG